MSGLNKIKIADNLTNIKKPITNFFVKTEASAIKPEITNNEAVSNKIRKKLINGILFALVPFIFIFVILTGLLIKLFNFAFKWLKLAVSTFMTILAMVGNTRSIDYSSFDKAIEAAGFAFDSETGTFYSRMNPWQRKYGYCRLYDEAASPLGMVVDCEPIYFKYAGKRWLVEFWKGQYDLTTGAEIGVYNTEGPSYNIPKVFNGTFYKSATNDERLRMAFTLKKNGKTLLKREDKHWWLTGFMVGEFSKPKELSMSAEVTLKDEIMRNAFIKGLKSAGYKDKEFLIFGNTVSIKFTKPKTRQPFTRIRFTDWLIQRKNRYMCRKFQKLTGAFSSMEDKLKAIQEKAPNLYAKIMNIGKTQKLCEKLLKINGFFS